MEIAIHKSLRIDKMREIDNDTEKSYSFSSNEEDSSRIKGDVLDNFIIMTKNKENYC